MKKYSLLFIITLLVFSISCDVIDQIPESDITQANFWKSPKDAEAGLIAVYSLYMSSAYNAFELGEIRSDNLEMPPKWGYEMIIPAAQNFNNNIISSTDGYANWTPFYNIISRANEVLYYTGRIVFADSLDKNRILGEAYFLRANAYFILARNWGAVPLIVEPFFSQGENMYVERTSIDRIYAQIESDVLMAEQLLPIARSDLRIRATKAAAQALACDVYLTRGSSLFSKPNDLESAILKADAILGNTNYKLESGAKYADIFRKKNSVESIFEVWYDYKNSATNRLCNFFMPRATNKKPAYGGETVMLPSHSLVNSFEPGDLRASTTYTVLSKEEEKYYDANVVGITYGNKYLGTVTEVGVQRYSDNNIIIYRLPDVMLMKAEALIMTDKINEGVGIVNQIRNRAGLAPKTETSKTGAIDLLLSERKKELAFEGKRWYDLLRTGKVNVFRAEPEFVQGRFMLPVPQAEVDRNPKLLPQNSTY